MPAPFPQPGTACPWNEYNILRRLGRGSFGQVFEALHTPTSQVVAVKQIALEASGDTGADSSHTQDLLEIQREISSLAQCQDCERVTRYYGSFVKKYTLWVVMELMDGGSCLSLLQRGGALPDAAIAVVCRELVLGLDYLHAQGIIHRDIKSANVLLTRQGQVKLGTYASLTAADFGVAAQLLHRGSRRNTLVGSPYWMAPEVIKQSHYDARADIWSLGITAIELATGHPPLSEYHPMRAMFLIPKATPPRIEAGHDPGLVRFVDRCLAKSATDRATARQLRTDAWIEQSGPLEILQRIIEARAAPVGTISSLSQPDRSSILDTSAFSEWQFDTTLDAEPQPNREPAADAATSTAPTAVEPHTPPPLGADGPGPWPATHRLGAEPSTPARSPRPTSSPRKMSGDTAVRSVKDWRMQSAQTRIQFALEQLAFQAGQDPDDDASTLRSLVHQMHALFSQVGRQRPDYLELLVDVLADGAAREGNMPRIPAAHSRLASLLYERWLEGLRGRWNVLNIE